MYRIDRGLNSVLVLPARIVNYASAYIKTTVTRYGCGVIFSRDRRQLWSNFSTSIRLLLKVIVCLTIASCSYLKIIVLSGLNDAIARGIGGNGNEVYGTPRQTGKGYNNGNECAFLRDSTLKGRN